MDDPNHSFEDLPDFGEVPPEFEEKKSTPTWIWVVGGIGILGICCVAAVCGSLSFFGDDIQGVFDEVAATVESSGGDFSDFEATVESSIPRSTPADSSENNGEPSDSRVEVDPSDVTYLAQFKGSGTWAEGDLVMDDGTIEAQGYVNGGVFEFDGYEPEGLYWTTAGESFGDGVYEVEVTAVDGPLNNGYGLMFFFEEATSSFYLLEISSDGFVWIGRCDNACDEIEVLVENGWFESSAVLQGLNVSNRLTVEVQNGNMRFLVNGVEVGRATDTTLTSGDVGLFIETLEEGGITIHFDNVSYDENR